MKKNLFILIILFIFIILSLLIFKTNKNETLTEEKKDINYNFNYPFYKEKLKEEYIKYQKKTNLPIKQAILEVNIGLNKNFYQDSKEVQNKNSLTILVNKFNYLPKTYEPSNLVTLNEYAKSGIRLNSIAYNAFKEMASDAEKEDLHLRIVSAYRSFDYQESLYNNYLKNEPQDKVDTYSARPGYSEHQTGLAVDIDNEKENYNRFHITQEFNWMKENAYKYGFILRYPLGKEYITGYKYEPWHYRYIGKEIANYIHNNNITYEEYYYEFIDK